MSQSRFSIVLVGVSALLRRPLVSRLRPADGEHSPWVVFAARVGRFDSGFRSVSWFFRWAGWPSGSLLRRLPLGGLALSPSVSEWPLGEFVLPPSASEIALGGLAFGLIASEIAIWRVGLWAHRFGNSARRVGLRAHCFRFSARTASGLPLGGLVLPPPASGLPSASWPSGSRLPLFGMRRSAPPRRRREGRRSTPTRHLFHFKTLIPTC